MPSVDATSSASSGTYTSDTQARIPTQVLGQNDFLKLLVAQLAAQDPMNPKKDTDFIAQMAQFSSLEQTKAMDANLAALRAQQDVLQANSLIGREVKLQKDKDTTVTGVVSAVNIEAGTPKIVVNGTAYELGQILSLTAPPPETSAPTTSQP
jgi:flagellar basal-body rod modification protein FlgD